MFGLRIFDTINKQVMFGLKFFNTINKRIYMNMISKNSFPTYPLHELKHKTKAD